MSQQSQTEENAFVLSGRKTGVQKREVIEYLDDYGTKHGNYADAYKASVKKKLIALLVPFAQYRANNVADQILNEFVVAFK